VQKQKRINFANRRLRWIREWGRVVFIDEAIIEYNQNPSGKKVRVRPGEELEEKNLKLIFKYGRTNVGVFAGIVK
jgi:uncharacterized protein YqkB